MERDSRVIHRELSNKRLPCTCCNSGKETGRVKKKRGERTRVYESGGDLLKRTWVWVIFAWLVLLKISFLNMCSRRGLYPSKIGSSGIIVISSEREVPTSASLR